MGKTETQPEQMQQQQQLHVEHATVEQAAPSWWSPPMIGLYGAGLIAIATIAAAVINRAHRRSWYHVPGTKIGNIE